jgi:glycosyltransferase involved in cell wall biosynthesis
MKKALIICSKYAAKSEDSYLTNDLVNEFVRQGYNVVVVGYGEDSKKTRNQFIEENIIAVNSKRKYIKYILLWPNLLSILFHYLIQNNSFDCVVAFAPLSVMWPASTLMPLFKSKNKAVIIFDIYPVHQVQINCISLRVEKILYAIEMMLLKPYNSILAMGEKNSEFIKKYYNVIDKKIKIFRLWGNKNTLENIINKPKEPIKIVFGGQIIPGRRLDKLIDFLFLIRGRSIDIELDIYSQGTAYDLLKDRYTHLKWISFNGQINRKDYFEKLLTYHIGAVVTDENVNLPTFPSKIIDYVAAGLYLVCLVENESELYGVIDDNPRVYINSFDFSDKEINRAVYFFQSITKNDTFEHAIILNELFDVNHVYKIIMK